MSSAPLSRHRCRRCLLLLAVVATLSTVATSDDNPFIWVDCQTSLPPSPAPSPPPFSPPVNSTFRSNVAALLDALPSAAAPAGFASLSRGAGTSRAFVRAMCRGDTAPENCATYLRSAAAGIHSRCNSSRRAAIWYDKCFISFADTNASTGYEDKTRPILYNTGQFSNNGAWAYYGLIGSLAARAVNGSTSPPMFATGQQVYDRDAPNGTIYGLVQCMRDRTAAECRQCLQGSVPQLPKCCWQHQGGAVFAYNCYLRVEIYPYYDLALDAPPEPPSSAPTVGERPGKKTHVILATVIPFGTILVAATALAGVFLYKRKVSLGQMLPENSSNEDDTSYFDSSEQLSLPVLRAATNNFSGENKLGAGGFGEVFKGRLQGGEVIAVKRLSKYSSQGFHELKNELVVAAKLKHRNLARLLGVCLQEEKLLVYEYMPNRSLDTFLFDPIRRRQLDWSKRFAIINGIARGLLYLHEESRLKIIHRDLKPSNVLLDADMTPKISDFRLARAFVEDQSRDITRRPVGTLGYMSPEYAYCGHVSTKSDIFSLGVMILEIVTGRRNNTVHECSDSEYLLGHVWGKWRTGSIAEVVDPSMGGQYSEDEVLNCVEVGLLCVEENPTDQPDASAVVIMLSNPTSTSGDRRTPYRPAFVFSSDFTTNQHFLTRDGVMIGNMQKSKVPVSENEVSISDLQPR